VPNSINTKYENKKIERGNIVLLRMLYVSYFLKVFARHLEKHDGEDIEK
jgi:hypothetical protein